MRVKPKSQLKMDQSGHFHQKFARMKFPPVKVDDPFAASEDKDIGVQHFCEEPKNDQAIGSCMKIGDFSAAFDYETHRNSDNTYGLDATTKEEAEVGLKYGTVLFSHVSLNVAPMRVATFNILVRLIEEDKTLQDLDRLLNYVDEGEDIHGTDALPSACEDYLLDKELAENASDFNDGDLNDSISDGPQFGNSSSGSQSPGFSRSSNGAFGVSDSTTGTPPEFECKSSSLQETENYDLRGAVRSKWRWGALVEDKFCATSLVSENTNAFYNYERNFISDYSEENTRSYPETRKYGSSRENRMRKRTRRYIEEFSDLKSEPCKRKGKVSSGAMRDKPVKVRSLEEPHQVPVEDSFRGAHFPSLSGIRRGRPKKQVPITGFKSEEEYTASDSEDDNVKTKRSKHCDRRKNQRIWTLSEVMKLVDGIAEYGTGRWTDIKRHLFSSSTYRTPIDLRDKWRNLLRTSSIQKENEGRAVQNQTHALRPLPKSLLQQVRELANIHPYPKERGLSTGSRGSSNSLTRTKFK